jgi:hypothetical protein
MLEFPRVPRYAGSEECNEQACTLSLTLALAVGRCSAPIHGPFTNEKDPWTRFTASPAWGGGGIAQNTWTGLEKTLLSPGFDS